MSTCGLDYLEDKEMTKRVADNIKNSKLIYYPKFEFERINDYEDEKMVFINKIKKEDKK